MCNGVWDCPWGTDEVGCTRTSCPGQFRCHNTSTCIAPDSMCNDINDCILGDDEYFCYPKLPTCPKNCTCIVYSISCFESMDLIFHSRVPFIHIDISFSVINSFTNLLEKFNQTVYLSVRNSGLIRFCSSLNYLPQKNIIRFLNIAGNLITAIKSSCLMEKIGLRYLNISSNNIKRIKEFAFVKFPSLGHLDISLNRLEYLDKNVFNGLNLSVLTLKDNGLFYVSPLTFHGSFIRRIVSEKYKICCIKSWNKTVCIAQIPWPFTCSYRLIGNPSMTAIYGIATFCGILLNIAAFAITHMQNKQSKKDVRYNYNLTVYVITMGDLLNSSSFLILLIADITYGNEYFTYEHSWRKSVLCYLFSFCSLSSNTISCCMITFIALSRYHLVIKPFDTIFLNSTFVIRCIVGITCIAFLSSFALILSHRFTSVTFPTGLCLLIGNIRHSASSLVSHCLVLYSLSIVTILIPVIYIMLHKAKKESSMNLPFAKKKETTANKSVFASCTHLVCWIPTAIILFLMLIWDEYPYQILLYSNMLVFPLNIFIDPFLFVLSKEIT